MKKFVLLFLSLWAIQLSMAQYVTPGNGTTYTLNDLVTVSNGAVQLVGSEFHITADLTITSPDIFSIQEDAVIIGTNGKRVYVQGQAQINPPNEVLLMSSDTTDVSNPFINLYLTENASNSVIRNLNVRFCCGLKIVEAQNVLVENCTFYKNQYKSTHGSGAITLSDCAPIIRNCTFIENVRSAISSPSNGSVTPTIEGCYMYHNVTGNNNMPQINLGPGSATDTVFIRNNYIEGHVTMSGGISLATMTGGTIIAVVENNEIVGNRYGINQFGNSITLFARNNEIVNNNLETNPNNGGSGITVYCTTENTTKLYATGNYISGNLWGITLVANASANLGNLNGTGIEYNIGHNIIVNNTNGGVEYNLYNNTVHPQMAQGNYWGFATAEESEAVIWHQPDIASLGLVTYDPIWLPVSCLGGIKNIPGDYATLEEAVTALNGAEICEGGVTFVLQNGVTYNTAPLTITATGSESSPIIFTANDLNGEKPIINVTATADAQAAINLVGSDYVTFNHLSIVAANEMLDYGIALTAENGINGCQYNTVSNCAVTMTKNTNNTNGIYTFCDTPTDVSGSNSFNQFYNNNISNCYIAINMMNDQSNSLYFDDANQVYATESGLSQYTNLMMCGVYAKGQKGFKVYNNVVSGVNETTETTNPAGMSFIDDNPTETLLQYNYEVYNNIIENIHSNTKTVYGIYFSARKTAAQIFGNIIRNVKTFANDNSTANGITIIASSTNVDFYNNMISDIAAAGCAVSNAPATRGIVISTSGSVNVYYNSVVLDYTATNVAHQCAPIFIHGNTTPYLLQNNIFANYAELPEGSTGRVVAYFKRNSTLNTDYINPLCNNNLYYAGVPSENHLVFYGHNSSSPLIDQTIATFKTRMAAVSPNLEQNSISVNPPFVNPLNDLHIIATEPTPIDGGGITVSGITTDIDGNIRDANTPDIGAHEFSVGSSCLPPTNLVQSVDYANQLLICEWDAPGNALTYNIWFNGMDVSAFAYNFGWMTDTSMVVPMSYLSNLPPAEEYCIKLRSICAIGDTSEWSETLCSGFGEPDVMITLGNITQTTVEAAFEKVAPCASYYILNGIASEMEMWMQMMQMTLEQLVQMWGLQIYNDTTYVWDELSPNTEYTIYALPLGADGTQYALQTQVYTTLSSGGSGDALVTIDLSEITPTSVRMIVTPNENTAVFFDGLITVELFNELGEEAAIDIIKTNGYPLYATDDWVWQGLLSNTAYKAIGIGMNADSVWGTATISEFSTLGDSNCNPPANLTAVADYMDIRLDWESPITRTDLFFEDFENIEGEALPEGWTAIDSDGDGYNWFGINDPQMIGHSGTGLVSSASWIGPVLTPDNWLITPQIAVSSGCTLNYWVSAQDASYAADHYGVYISTTGTSPNDFTLLFEETMTAKNGEKPGTRGVSAQGQWYERTIDISNFSGPVHIAFRHFNCSDQFRINVDDVRIFDASTNVFNVYRNNTLIAEQISTLFYIDPVTEIGEHCYTVTTVCGATESDPSNTACANAFAPECIAPSNLLALDNNNNVDLTWEASPTAVSYKVFTNGYMLASELTETTYTDASLGAGTYCYTVKAVCAYGESENSNEACATIDEGVCNPPANVAAVATDDQITVTWDEPFTGKAWMTWSGNPATAVGTGSAADFSVAHRYETTDLTAYDGLQLTKIRLVPNVDVCDYSLRVWVGGDGTAPEEMIVDQPITQNLSYGVWNEVVLNTPVTIDADRELWIGYRCNTQTGTPAGCDEGPQVAGKGNMIFLNNIWDQMNNLAPTLTFNWCIKSLVVTANGKSIALPALVDESNTFNSSSLMAVKTETNSKATLDDNLKYDLYRNGTLLAEGITERTYVDENLTMGQYCYTVVALCDNGDSDPSEEACTDIISINEEETAYRIFPNPANNSLNIEGENIETISVYNILGQMIDHVQEIHQTTVKLNTTTYENGTYILRIVNQTGNVVEKRVVIIH